MSDENKKPRKPFPAALASLKNEKCWVLWKWVEKNGKLTKPPFQPRFPDRLAKNNTPGHWSDFKTALRAYREGKADGIGPVTSQDAERSYVDFDDCRDPVTGKISEAVMDIVIRANTYCEVTPSGTGIRMIGTAARLRGRVVHRTFRTATMKGEVFYRAVRYVTVTGDRLPETPDALSDIGEIITNILNEAKSSAGVGESSDTISGDDDELTGLDLNGPLRLSEEQIRTLLKGLPGDDAKDPETGGDWWTYDRWMAVLFAVHDDTDGSEEGFALLDEWCSKSKHYNPEGLRAKWDSARGSNVGQARTTIKTLIKWSNEWTKPERDRKVEDIAERIARAMTITELDDLAKEARSVRTDSALLRLKLNHAYKTATKKITGVAPKDSTVTKMLAYVDPDLTVMPAWLRSFVFVSGENAAQGYFHDASTGLNYSAPVFDLTFGRKFMSQEEIAQEAVAPATPPSLTARNRFNVPVVDGLGYRPFKESGGEDDGLNDDAESVNAETGERIVRPRIYVLNGRRLLNTYHTRDAVPAVYGPYTTEQRDDLEAMLKLVRRVCGSKREFQLFLSVVRYILIERKRVNFMCIFCSAEGSGKTTVAVTMMRLILGASNVGVYPPSALLDQSDQSWQAGHLLKIIEEMYLPDARSKAAVAEKIKPIITNEVVTPRLMYRGFTTTLNTATYIGLTNHDNVLALNSGDTRIFPIFPTEKVATPAQMAETRAADPDFYTRANAAIRRNIGVFRGWLEREFQYHPDFKPETGRAPASETKQRIVEQERDPLLQDIFDILDEEKAPLLTRNVVCLQSLVATLHERNVQINTDGGRQRTNSIVGALLRKNGYRQFGERMRLPAKWLKADDTDLEAAGDNRVTIYTTGVGPLRGKKAVADSVARYAESWLSDL